MTVGDELRTVRLDRDLTQHQVAEQIGVNRNFVYEMELGHHTNTIYALHKVYVFLGYIPKTLRIDESVLQGRLYVYRVKRGYTHYALSLKIGIDKSTLARFEKGKNIKQKTYLNIVKYLNNI
ncbi:MAG: helix-turn-helix domain-containing protein [bacterium]|nr:helix-turn-helix domain-containing protein [bacterium]